jgi:hypothetical protein
MWDGGPRRGWFVYDARNVINNCAAQRPMRNFGVREELAVAREGLEGC